MCLPYLFMIRFEFSSFNGVQLLEKTFLKANHFLGTENTKKLKKNLFNKKALVAANMWRFFLITWCLLAYKMKEAKDRKVIPKQIQSLEVDYSVMEVWC